jgi:hypothetical protein
MKPYILEQNLTTLIACGYINAEFTLGLYFVISISSLEAILLIVIRTWCILFIPFYPLFFK